MFVSGIPKEVAQQIASCLEEASISEVYVCCSGSFRSERTVFATAPAAKVYGNDVSLYSCAIGQWLAGGKLAFTFKDALAPLEELMGEGTARRRAAGAALAVDMARFGAGKPNAFKLKHLEHLMATAAPRLDALEQKLEDAFCNYRLAGFRMRDWIEHMREGAARGAMILAFPPTDRGGYEKAYSWLEANVAWEPPSYAMWDPKDLDSVVHELHATGAPYWVFAARELRDLKPATMFEAWGKRTVYGYARTERRQWRRQAAKLKPFAYKPIDLAALHAGSKVQVRPVDGPSAMYIRTVYIKNSISPAPALQNYFVMIDGMLAGVLCYNINKMPSKEQPFSAYLLCDLSLSREARLSKLIARLALNRQVLGHFASRMLRPMEYVSTTAFSDHPVSMKYRGIWDLQSRIEVPPSEGGGFRLQYGAPAIDETIDEAFAWWWASQAGAGKKPAAQGSKQGAKHGGKPNKQADAMPAAERENGRENADNEKGRGA